ncbi:MAG: N-acetylglutaminylglutamine synthetase [Gammaproteobacteria bacterium]|jgi:GNAT-family acetyltransferase (TIGR03103 family)|nr:N-acetylglutaminylglutamine synthetase [Gammaproteobacteria bacterium]
MVSETPATKPTSIFCGWGRVLFGQTFAEPEAIANEMLREEPDKRDIAAYISDPHVVLSYAPQRLFLDPSDMLRLSLANPPAQPPHPAFVIRRAESAADATAINELYLKRGMVPSEVDFILSKRAAQDAVFLVAVDAARGRVLGTVMGLDHTEIFADPENGSSLWCLAVDPAAMQPGIGQALTLSLAHYFAAAGRAFMDLSVIHDNSQAKALYRKLGFRNVQQFAIKTKNAHNENLFIGPELDEDLNPYAEIIVNEARWRGISAEVLDGEQGYFLLSRGGRSVACRESLSDLTSAVAMSRCQDKQVTHRWLQRAGIKTPEYMLAADPEANERFLKRHGKLVVKPVMGEQGKGVTVGVATPDALRAAVAQARQYGGEVLLETWHPGQDLRVVVIGEAVAAAAIRQPASVIGDGKLTIEELIAKQSRRRAAATKGESTIPMDAVTRECVAAHGYELADVLPSGELLQVRRTANLHTGGTIHDVTEALHPALADAALRAAQVLEIPVVGIDMIVAAPDQPDYVIIEANERPGLANHEPQNPAARFIDLLFPFSQSAAGQARGRAAE